MQQTHINQIVEGALLASSTPLTIAQLAALFTVDEPPPDGSLQAALGELQAACADRGVELVEVASGWRYQVKRDVHAWVARLWTERQTKYTRATLETLALIAYRQPITRGEIEQIRGVATNSNIIKALEEREWIRSVGHRDVPGRPELLGTTKTFLDYFGLKKLDELPPLSELKDFGELEPQFNFDDAPITAKAKADADADPDAASDEAGGQPTEGDDETNIATPTDNELDAEPDTGIDINTQTRGTADTEADAEPTHPQSEPEDDIAADGEVRS